MRAKARAVELIERALGVNDNWGPGNVVNLSAWRRQRLSSNAVQTPSADFQKTVRTLTQIGGLCRNLLPDNDDSDPTVGTWCVRLDEYLATRKPAALRASSHYIAADPIISRFCRNLSPPYRGPAAMPCT